MKGLQRSINRGNPQLADVIKATYVIDGVLTITGAAGLVDAGTFVFGGLPEGNLLILGAVAYVEVDAEPDADVIDNWDGDYGIGSAPNADLDLADAGDDDFIPSTALSAGASDKTAPLTRGTSTEATEQGVILDNTDGSLELNLNLLIDDNVITDAADGTFKVKGFLHLAFIVLGDD